MEKRKCVYYLENCGDFSALEDEVKQIKGVLGALVDRDECVLTYEIDEWSSDYDVFTEVLRLAESAGCVIDFEKTDKKTAELSKTANGTESETLAAEAKNSETKTAEKAAGLKASANNENGKNAKRGYGEDDNGDNGEGYIDSEDGSEGKTRSKPRKTMPEAVQNLIIFSAGLVALVIGYLVKNDSAKTVMLALAFALSGYELLYDVTCDVLKKRILTPELIALLGVVAALFLGYAEQAVTAMLLLVALRNCVLALKKLVLKNTPARDIDEKLGVLVQKNGKEREIEVLVCDITEGDVLNYRKGEKCRFNCVLISDFATVSRAEDEEVTELELKKGDKVLKGDELLSTARLRVETGFLGELNGFERSFVARVREKGAFSQKFEKKRVIICSAAILLCLLIAFVLPVFSADYVSGLYRWGYFAAILAVVLAGGKIADVAELACVASLACGYKNGIIAFGQSGYCAADKCELVALDKENALDLPSGELKGDCAGAVRELKDCGKRLALLTLLNGEKAAELCTELKIHEYYCFNGEQEKAKKIKEFCASGVLCVTNAKNAKNACGLSVALCAGDVGDFGNLNEKPCEKVSEEVSEKAGDSCSQNGCSCGGEQNGGACDSALSSSALIFNDEIAFAPYAVKLAKRAAKIKKLSAVFGLSVKAVLIALGAFGLASIWWVVLADVCVGAVFAVLAALLGKDVY